ncbi:hypothetical protein [Streptomyces sp. NPDC008001]|uniref:hypothetical protein n=1 Tax=Streptomyces sp. NPDC008001 TaxID=3364804 RepID=UPI0036E343DF
MPHTTPYEAPRTAGDQSGRRARALTGALAIAALVAALVALWQTQSTPLGGHAYCWGAWPEGEAPFRRGDHDRTADERVPSPGRPTGHCSLRWRGGQGPGAYEQRVDLRLGTGPREAGERRSWLGELFGGGDVPLPDGLPGFTAAASGTGALVLPESCDVDGRPSVVTLKSFFSDTATSATHPGFSTGLTPATAGELLVRAANKATRATSCTTLPPLRLRREPSAPTTPVRASPGPDEHHCGIAGLGKRTAPGADAGTGYPTGNPDSTSSTGSGSSPDSTDFHSCAIAGAQEHGASSGPGPGPTSWAARFITTGRPRLVALFDGLTGDRPPAPGWRAHGTIDASGALVRADCGGRPTVFTMRSGPGRTHTRLDDPRQVFPLYVDAVTGHMGCAPLRAG